MKVWLWPSHAWRWVRGDWRRLVKGSLLALAAVVVTLLALEIALRLFDPHPFGPESELAGMYENDGESSYRLSPGWQGQLTVEGTTVPIRINEQGMRGPEIVPRRGAEQLRVLCLGDSFVFGYGIEDQETFAAQLPGEITGDVFLDVVVGNAGIPGHGTVDMVRMFEHHREAFDPDVVIASIYLGNDFVDDFTLTKIMVRGHFMVGFYMPGHWARAFQTTWRGRLALTSRLAMKIEQWLLINAPSIAFAPSPTLKEATAFAGFPPETQRLAGLFMDAVDEERFREEVTGSVGIPRILARIEESLRALQTLAGDAPVIMLILPTSHHVEEDRWAAMLTQLGFDPTEFRFGLTQERLLAICARLGLPAIDFTAAARELADPQSVFLPENKHLNQQGHQLAARLLGERIRAILGK